MIRILQVVNIMDRAGLETMLMNYYRALDRSQFQFDFLTHRIEKHEYDDEILSLGGKIYHISRLNPFSVSYKKELLEFLKKHPEYNSHNQQMQNLNRLLYFNHKIHYLKHKLHLIPYFNLFIHFFLGQ